MSTKKANKPPKIVDVPVVISIYFALLGLACLVVLISQGILLIPLWILLFAIALSAILAIPIVLSNGISYLRVLQEEQNELLRELTREHPAKLQHAEAQMFASYVAAIDLKARLNSVDSESPDQRETVAELQAAIARLTARLDPLSTQVDFELQKAKTEALRNRLMSAVELIRQQLIPCSAQKLSYERSLWRSSQEACAKVARRLEILSEFDAWDEQLKTVLGFEQLRATQQQFAQLGEWPQRTAPPGVVIESNAPAGTGLYEYTKAQKAAEKSLDRWRRQLERDPELDE